MNDSFDYSIFTQELADLSKTGFFKINLCDQSSYANQEWYRCFGATPGTPVMEAVAQHPYIHPVDKYSINSFLTNARQGYEKRFQSFMRVRVPGRDMMWRWYQVSMIVTRFEPANNIVDVIGINHDVSVLVDNDTTSITSMSHITDLLKTFNTLPWVYDFRTRTIVSNRSFISRDFVFDDMISHMSYDEFMQTVLPDYRPLIESIYERIVSGQIIKGNAEIKMRMGASRAPVWVDFSIVVQEYDHNGRVATAVGACTVINDRKLAELAMLDAQEKAEKANEAKSKFLASMSHELRTPLNAILGFSTVMAHSSTIEERMQCLGAIQSSGAQLMRIIEDVLEYAKIESGGSRLRREHFDLVSALERATEEAAPLRNPGVEMTFCCEDKELPIRADKSKLSLVAKHLLFNAAKYTNRGSITLTLTHTDTAAVVTISDTGQGMTKEVVEHMFDRFFKGETYVPGTGIGLCIVKSYIDLWQGAIDVQSQPGEGTTITFTVPM